MFNVSLLNLFADPVALLERASLLGILVFIAYKFVERLFKRTTRLEAQIEDKKEERLSNIESSIGKIRDTINKLEENINKLMMSLFEEKAKQEVLSREREKQLDNIQKDIRALRSKE